MLVPTCTCLDDSIGLLEGDSWIEIVWPLTRIEKGYRVCFIVCWVLIDSRDKYTRSRCCVVETGKV